MKTTLLSIFSFLSSLFIVIALFRTDIPEVIPSALISPIFGTLAFLSFLSGVLSLKKANKYYLLSYIGISVSLCTAAFITAFLEMNILDYTGV